MLRKGDMWRRMALWKVKEHLKREPLPEDCYIQDNYKSFDLAVPYLVETPFYGRKLAVKELVKAVVNPRYNQSYVMKCLEDAVEVRKNQKGVWVYRLKITWVTPSLEASRDLHYVLKRIMVLTEFWGLTNRILVWNDAGIDGQNKLYEAKAVKIEEETYVDDDDPNVMIHKRTYIENDNPDAMVLFDIATDEEIRRLPYHYPYGPRTHEKKRAATPSRTRGRRARNLGILKQREVHREMLAKGYKVIYSEEFGQPDILVVDHQDRVVEVVAVKAYSLEVTVGSGCRNVKGHKYAVSFNPKKDAKAECRAALQNGLDKIRLIFINLKTGNKIFDGPVGLDETVTIREYPKDQNPD